MNALMVLFATAALGIEVGWEPLPGGGHEYTVQLEPQLLKVLEGGRDEVFSEVPEGVQVRRYRIVVGVGKLRRDYGPLAAEIEPPPTGSELAAPAFESPQQQALEQQPLTQAELSTSPNSGTSPHRDPYGTEEQGGDLETIPPSAESTIAPDFGAPLEHSSPSKAETGNPSTQPPAAVPHNPVADPWADNAAKSNAVGGSSASALGESSQIAQSGTMPGKLPPSDDPSAPLKTATFDAPNASADEGVREAGKPQLGESEPDSRPWTPLVISIILLACSLGGNVFLGWIAVDARSRYRVAMAKFRGVTA